MGFAVSSGGRKAAVVTDLGLVTEAVRAGMAGASLVLVEANHDEEWVRSGPYPYALKARILGDRGHLSNEAGGLLARSAVEAGARTVVLAHLSRENNTPEHALAAVSTALLGCGIHPGRDMLLEVAPRSGTGHTYPV